jgi:hypothetical protein
MLVFLADDGQQKSEQSIIFDIVESVALQQIQQINNTSSSGGGTVGLGMLLLIVLSIVTRKVRGDDDSGQFNRMHSYLRAGNKG